MQEEKRNDNYPDCKKTCQMVVRVPETDNEEKIICPWLPCYYKVDNADHSEKNPSPNR